MEDYNNALEFSAIVKKKENKTKQNKSVRSVLPFPSSKKKAKRKKA